jgi:dTDP-4-amino-4,6-dideoxygalactose transaminase/nucleoside-diphosphate-sugar epimerase
MSSHAASPLPDEVLSPAIRAAAKEGSRWVVLGGAGFLGGAVCRHLNAAGHDLTSIDVVEAAGPWPRVSADLLVDPVSLPPGRVAVALGRSTPRPLRPWTLALDNALLTARVAPQLADRPVTLLSSIEVYGPAPGPLTEDTPLQLPAEPEYLEGWVDKAVVLAASPCPPHRAVSLCRELVELDASGRWVYALSKVAQELILRRFVAPDRLTVLRLANVVGVGQFRVVSRLVEAMLDGRPYQVTDTVRSFVSVAEVARVVHLVETPGTFNVSSGALELREVAELVGDELGCDSRPMVVPPPRFDSCGVVDATKLGALLGDLEDVREGLRSTVRSLAGDPGPMFRPPLPVVLPPRPERPDVVSDRIAASLWTGKIRDAHWSAALIEALTAELQLGDDRRVVLTNSGTNALRLAVSATVGTPAPGDVAVCPAFTFHATAEVLYQLGWNVRLVDIDPDSWNLDSGRLAEALDDPAVRLVVPVDAFGNPCDYDSLRVVCERAGVPLVGDSAAALGSRYGGAPVGTQAQAHAFSMSFAKVVSGGGSGGAVVLPAELDLSSRQNWVRSAPMTEASAVVALDGLAALPELVARRHVVAATYNEILGNDPAFGVQRVRPEDTHSLVHWVMRVGADIDRDLLAAGLVSEGVQTKPYYEPLLGLPGREAVPITTALHPQTLALPMSSELCRDDAERVAVATMRVARRLRAGKREARRVRVESVQEPAPLGAP